MISYIKGKGITKGLLLQDINYLYILITSYIIPYHTGINYLFILNL